MKTTVKRIYSEAVEKYHEEAVRLLILGKLDAAVNIYHKLLAVDATYPKAYSNLGMIFKLQGDLQKAEEYYQKALNIDPTLVPVYSNLANIYRMKGELAKAEEFCNKAIHFDPGFADAYNILGAVLQIQGKNDQAIKNYRRAIKLAPGFIDAYSNLGTALQAIGHLDESIACYRKATELDWEDPNPYYNLGNILKNNGDVRKATDAYEMAIKLEPDFSDAYNQLIDIARQCCLWRKLREYSKKLDQLTLASVSQHIIYGETPFTAIVGHDDPERNVRIAKRWSSMIAASAKNAPFSFKTFTLSKHRRLRIGYVSGNFTDHPVGHLIKNMFSCHDRKKFKIYGYSFGEGDTKGYRKAVKEGCDTFYDIDTQSFDATARQIYHDKIDILVDLMGYTDGARFEIFARHPAPIQVAYLGFPGSTGADFIDYQIVDRVLVPPDQVHNYSEKLIFMPDCYQVNDRTQIISRKQFKRSDVGLPEDAFVFASFNKVSKITPEMFRSWVRILHAVPKSVLWLPQSILDAEANIKKEAKKKGLHPERIIFAKNLSLEEHLKRLTLADLMLDTHPYSGGATTSHALRMGVPVVTVAGKSYIARMSASLLTSVGLSELITPSFVTYEQLAIKLATDHQRLKEIKNKLKKNLKTTTLFNTEQFVTNLEEAYIKIWNHYISGSKPTSKRPE